MKKGITCIVVLFLLMSLTGCGKEERESKRIPALLEPVGVQMDMAPVVRDEIFQIETYNGEVVPYVEELQFAIDGNLEEDDE